MCCILWLNATNFIGNKSSRYAEITLSHCRFAVSVAENPITNCNCQRHRVSLCAAFFHFALFPVGSLNTHQQLFNSAWHFSLSPQPCPGFGFLHTSKDKFCDARMRSQTKLHTICLHHIDRWGNHSHYPIIILWPTGLQGKSCFFFSRLHPSLFTHWEEISPCVEFMFSFLRSQCAGLLDSLHYSVFKTVQPLQFMSRITDVCFQAINSRRYGMYG